MRSLLVTLMLLLLVGCRGPYDIAWSTTATVREGAFQIEAGLAKRAKEASAECLKQHGAEVKPYADCAKACKQKGNDQSPEYKACIEPCVKQFGAATKPYKDCVQKHRDVLGTWIKYVRPSINSSLSITVSSIQVAERTKDKNLPWIEYLKPAVCAVCQAVTQWDKLMPDNVRTQVMIVCKTVSTVTCEKK